MLTTIEIASVLEFCLKTPLGLVKFVLFLQA